MLLPELSARPLRALCLVALLALTGCATFQVSAHDDSGAGIVRHTSANAFFWGAVPGTIPYDACGIPGDKDGNGLWQVRYRFHAGHILASAVTLGIWTPMEVAYQCAVPRPTDIGIGGPECEDHSAHKAGDPTCTLATAGSEAPIPGPSGDAFDLDCQEDATWQNVSHSVTATPKKLCHPKPGHGFSVPERAAPLVALIKEAADKKMRIRAVGAGWSFSRAAASDGIMVDMRWYGGSLPLPSQGDWAAGTAGRFYAHFEAGASVDAVNLALLNSGYSLFTMGGSAGQTWVGAVATGTHGGDTIYPAIADFVRAFSVVTEGGELLWIERASDPLSRGGYAKRIGARLIQDDEIFDAAVVGLGTFGIVSSAVIEVQKLESYLLWRQRFDYDDKLRHVMETFDFTGWKWPDPLQRAIFKEHVDQQGTTNDSTLRHFEVVVNPYSIGVGGQGAFVTTVWDDNHFVAPGVATKSSVNISMPIGTAVVRILGDKHGPDVPAALKILLPTQYSEITTPLEGPLRTLFPKGIPSGGGLPMSMELALARADVNKAMDVILKEIGNHPDDYYYPGVVAFRFSEPTRALLGFSSFTPTVTIEFPTVSGVKGTEAFFTRVHAALTKAGIAHTQHLGQWNTYSAEPSGMQAFGDRVARFRAVREKLLSPAARERFANEYTDRLGITSPPKP